MAAGAVIGLLAFARPGQAHARLVSAAPAPNTEVAAPRAVLLTFSEPIVQRFSGFELSKTDASANAIAVKAALSGPKMLVGDLPGPLARGVYRVAWHAVANDDGHRTSGAFVFKVH